QARSCTTLHYRMSKDHVYSWRLRGDLKEALGEAARDEKVSVADLLERIASDWLARRSSMEDEGEIQRRLHGAAAPCVGSVNGGDPNRAQEARERVRSTLARKHAG
ncbi:MAG: hypothetical protein OXG72_03900, partial [Acidobacteria bacterium]|nr:hypothetical protein [Acidobacteriota bacterium]